MRRSPLSMTMQSLVALLILLAFSGCFAVGPDYKSPDIAAPDAWATGLSRGVNADEPEAQMLAQWWTTFGDADLSNLVERAIAENVDLQRAQARIREARAARHCRSGSFALTRPWRVCDGQP